MLSCSDSDDNKKVEIVTVDPDRIEFKNGQKTEQITVTCNGKWTAELSDDS